MKYGLRSKKQFQSWIIKYNGHEEIRSSGARGNQIMTKRRATTIEERIEIVECIKNGRGYNETARKHIKKGF